jgi:hypothetical protein
MEAAMRRVTSIGSLLLVTTAALAALLVGCSDTSSGPDDTPDLTYPDIPGIVVFYDFNGDLDNETSEEHGGTREGRPTYTEDRHGNADSAILIANNGDAVQVPYHEDLDITGDITLAAWVSPNVNSHAYGSVIDKGYLVAYSLGIPATTMPDTMAASAYVADVNFWAGNCVPTGTDTWTHVVFTFTQADNYGKFYVNGAYVGGFAEATAIGVTDFPLKIGISNYGDPFRGKIDQVAIFDRALTPDDVEELYEFD